MSLQYVCITASFVDLRDVLRLQITVIPATGMCRRVSGAASLTWLSTSKRYFKLSTEKPVGAYCVTFNILLSKLCRISLAPGRLVFHSTADCVSAASIEFRSGRMRMGLVRHRHIAYSAQVKARREAFVASADQRSRWTTVTLNRTQSGSRPAGIIILTMHDWDLPTFYLRA